MLDLDIESIKIGIRIDHDFDDDYIENVLLPAAERQVQGLLRGSVWILHFIKVMHFII